MKARVILTGATGMVGEGVLHECLLSPDVEAVLSVSRRPCGVTDPKLKEVIVEDFFNLSAVEKDLTGYNACFFCLGVSSVGMREKEYTRLTYDLTMYFARTVARLNPDMVFCYVSGSGTDSTQKGRIMWARVKGKTENHLMTLPFKKSYMFRPGYIHPTPGLKNTLKMYRYFSWMYPLLLLLFPRRACSLREVGRAMIACATNGPSKSIVDVKKIVLLANP